MYSAKEENAKNRAAFPRFYEGNLLVGLVTTALGFVHRAIEFAAFIQIAVYFGWWP